MTEQEILKFWQENKIFKKSLNAQKGNQSFVFYEGPPYANGRPGIHHTESRVFKDIVLRYKTMRGFYAPRRAGWDTHGLPTEMEVEKILGVKSKKEIEEKIGIEKFVQECRKNVFLYKEEWEKFSERIAYWLDLDNAYVTMENYYIETLWWIVKKIHERGLLYEDYKVLPWCPRCQTALSSHEVAQGYKNIKEPSIYVKFKNKKEKDVYFLVWTTTPWTLPGNVALAVNPEMGYVKIKKDNEQFILMEERATVIGKEYQVVEKFNGKDLVGIEYGPLYPDKSPYKIIAGDFVSAQDGTGIVHIAPAFGEDDMKIGRINNLPVLITVNDEGKMIATDYKWNGIFIKDADELITEDLKNRNLLFDTELYEHDYPFCWRCQAPLMYYAKNSWWFKTTAVKEKLLRENSKIDWHPHYLKDGRFGEWLKEVRDWVISRERYWGAPLPIWECDKCKEMKVVGSIDEIRNEIGGLNKIFLVRHGEAKNNVDDILSGWPETEIFRLTEKGREKVKKTADSLKEEKIKAIFCSPVTRTRETAEIIAEELGLELIIDERLQEMGFGELNGKTTSEFDALFPTKESRAEKAGFGVETGENIRKRLQKFLDEVNEKYKNENIVVVSHGDPIQIFYGFTQGKSLFESFRGWYPDIGSLKITYSKPIDLHRPYIDKIVLKCGKCGGVMRRVPEVMDVWFDSGSMPYAQAHYPFENKKDIDERKFFPADYICEGLDQTRGWFYTLLAVSSLLGFEAPYKNVISLGLVLDEKSQKMSKSRGNVVEPMQLVEKYGADAVRWYFYTVNQPWDEKLFSEKDVAHALRRFLMIFSNCAAYFKTYSSCNASRVSHCDLVLNKWVIARLNQTVKKVTELLDNYDIVSAARKIEEFVVEDISHWYIRGIRNFIKEPEKAEAKESITVLGYILMETSRLLAPFVPFTAEKTYKELGGQKESVHLEEWPTAKEIIKEEEKILEEMEKTKKIVSLAIEERQKAGFGVRQSLSSFSTTHTISDEFSEIARREINVKEIKTGQKENKLDTTLTPELKNEGIIRELIRNIQDLRKKAGLVPQQKIELAVETDIGGERLIEQFEAEIKRATNTTAVEFAKNNGEEINIRGLLFKIKIKK